MEPSEQVASVQQNPEKKRTSPTHSNAQVLIVDSHPAMSRILSRLVKKAGVSYAVARSGEEAISFCKDSNFELILMEVNMAGINGLEATKSIRALSGNYGNIPIVAVAARMTDKDIE
ncbi:MAG: response regulator, partial [Kordiimonas sp.]